MVWLGRRCPDSGDVRWFYVSRGKKPNWTNISRGTPKPNHLLRLPRASTKLYQHLPSDKTIPSLHLPRSETKPSLHLPRNNTKHLPSKYEANHLYVSRVTFIFWLISFHITLTPFEPSRAEPNEPDNITSPEKIWTKPTLHLPSKYEPNHLYISRVTFIFWTAIFIYYLRPPPLWSGPRSKQKDISRVTKSIPSLHISSIQPRDLNPKMGGCVSPRGREPGGHTPSHLWIEVSEGLTVYQTPVDLNII